MRRRAGWVTSSVGACASVIGIPFIGHRQQCQTLLFTITRRENDFRALTIFAACKRFIIGNIESVVNKQRVNHFIGTRNVLQEARYLDHLIWIHFKCWYNFTYIWKLLRYVTVFTFICKLSTVLNAVNDSRFAFKRFIFELNTALYKYHVRSNNLQSDF